MDISIGRVIEEKRVFIAKLQALLHADQRSEVKQLAYKVTMRDDEIVEEHIDVIFLNNYVKTVRVTHNSNGANLYAVAKAVYGG